MPKNSSKPCTVGRYLLQVAEVVLAELTGGVPQRLEELGDGRILGGRKPTSAPGTPTLLKPVRKHALAGDERRPAGRAAFLPVGVGEPHALVGDAVDVRRAVAHQAVAVAAEVADPDVVTPDDENVGLSVGQALSPLTGDAPAGNTRSRAPHTGWFGAARTGISYRVAFHGDSGRERMRRAPVYSGDIVGSSRARSVGCRLRSL